MEGIYKTLIISKMNERLHLYVNNLIDYVDLSWGNYQKNILLDNEYSDEVIIKINTLSNKEQTR